jgi:hypothetical protein
MSQHPLTRLPRAGTIVAAVLVFALACGVLMVAYFAGTFIDARPDSGVCRASRKGWMWLEVGVAFAAVLVAAYAITAAVRARRTLVPTAVAIAVSLALDLVWFAVLVAIPDPRTIPC